MTCFFHNIITTLPSTRQSGLLVNFISYFSDKKPPPVLKTNQSSKQFNTEDIVSNVNGEPEKKPTESTGDSGGLSEPPVDYEVASDSDSSDFEDEDDLTEEEVSRRQGFKQDKVS